MNGMTIQMNELYPDADRVQYDGKDGDRIKAVADGVMVYAVAALEALGAYSEALEAEASEDSVYKTKIARQEVVEAYALLEIMAQKMAWSLRIDATEASQRAFQAIKSGEPVSIVGL
jgi:hypothetical protein